MSRGVIVNTKVLISRIGIVAAAAAIVVLLHFGWHVWEPFQHWLAIHTGTINEPGPYYGFFSGFGSDLGEVTLIAALLAVFRKHNCHVKGCWRIGKHSVDGSPWCSKHHMKARQDVADTGSAHGVEADDSGVQVVGITTIDTSLSDDQEDEHEASLFGFRSAK